MKKEENSIIKTGKEVFKTQVNKNQDSTDKSQVSSIKVEKKVFPSLFSLNLSLILFLFLIF
jgi:hypothetical protein